VSHGESERLRRRDVVVIGASAGGVEALATIARGFPDDLPAAVFVVLHLPEGGTSYLPGILGRAGRLPVLPAQDDSRITRGAITVAPPDHHLVLERERTRLVRGPKVNGYRPAVDVLFHSAARSYDGRVVGIVLSGTQSDGTLGLRAIKRRGGGAIVQGDAVHQGMPTSAIRNVQVDAVVPLREIANTLTIMLGTEEVEMADEESVDESALEAGFDIGQLEEAPGDPSIFRCPECGGALWELDDGELNAYICHVGHSFSADSLLALQRDGVERALWSAARLLEERRALNERLAERVGGQGLAKSRDRFARPAERAYADAHAIRKLLQVPDADAREDSEGEAA